MNPWRSLAELPREVWVLFATTLINRAGTMAIPFLVLYLTQSLNLSAGQAGLVLAAYGVGSFVTSPVAGRLCDYAGAARIMKLSLLSSGAVLVFFPLARSFIAILALTLIWAILSEAFRPASLVLTADIVSPEQRKSAFALTRLAINLGMSIGPVVGGFLAMVSFPAIFLVDGATSILAGIVLVASRLQARPQSAPDDVKTESAPTGLLPRTGVLADRHFLYFLAALIPVLIVFFQNQAAMPLFLVRDLGMTAATYGILFAINTVMVILIEVPLNTAMAEWPHRPALALGAVLCGVGYGGLIFANGFLSVAATIVLWTFGEMILFPTASAYVADLAPAHRRGEYMGLFQMSFSLAFTLGPWVGAVVFERFGPSTLWSATFVCSLLSALMMWKLYAKPAPDLRQRQ
jgi:predicted MFS family arabinose efflux permease